MAPPTASTSSASLHLVPVRRATFHKSRKAAATKSLNWPYPLTGAAAKASSIHPDRLADAGFFATPTRDDPTVTTCFLCDVVIGEWEEGEDPLYRHQAAADEAGIRCGWVTVLSEAWDPDALDSRAKDGWDELWGDEGELHPRGGRMGAAREHTFRLGWPHDDEEGVPTKEEARLFALSRVAYSFWFALSLTTVTLVRADRRRGLVLPPGPDRRVGRPVRVPVLRPHR